MSIPSSLDPYRRSLDALIAAHRAGNQAAIDQATAHHQACERRLGEQTDALDRLFDGFGGTPRRYPDPAPQLELFAEPTPPPAPTRELWPPAPRVRSLQPDARYL